MQQRTESTASFVTNSEHLINILKSIQLNDNNILDSLDIKSLYPSVPAEDLIKIAQWENLSQHTIELSKQCLKNTYFIACNSKPLHDVFWRWSPKNHKLGFKLMIFRNCGKNTWMTFLLFGLMENYNFTTFWHIKIVYTIGSNSLSKSKLPFLDLLITRKLTGSLGYTV